MVYGLRQAGMMLQRNPFPWHPFPVLPYRLHTALSLDISTTDQAKVTLFFFKSHLSHHDRFLL